MHGPSAGEVDVGWAVPWAEEAKTKGASHLCIAVGRGGGPQIITYQSMPEIFHGDEREVKIRNQKNQQQKEKGSF